MSVESAKAKLPKSGDICTSCAKYWREQGKTLKYMVHVNDDDGNIITTEGGIPIVVCPWCDGDYILLLDKHIEEEL